MQIGFFAAKTERSDFSFNKVTFNNGTSLFKGNSVIKITNSNFSENCIFEFIDGNHEITIDSCRCANVNSFIVVNCGANVIINVFKSNFKGEVYQDLGGIVKANIIDNFFDIDVPVIKENKFLNNSSKDIRDQCDECESPNNYRRERRDSDDLSSCPGYSPKGSRCGSPFAEGYGLGSPYKNGSRCGSPSQRRSPYGWNSRCNSPKICRSPRRGCTCGESYYDCRCHLPKPYYHSDYGFPGDEFKMPLPYPLAPLGYSTNSFSQNALILPSNHKSKFLLPSEQSFNKFMTMGSAPSTAGTTVPPSSTVTGSTDTTGMSSTDTNTSNMTPTYQFVNQSPEKNIQLRGHFKARLIQTKKQMSYAQSQLGNAQTALSNTLSQDPNHPQVPVMQNNVNNAKCQFDIIFKCARDQVNQYKAHEAYMQQNMPQALSDANAQSGTTTSGSNTNVNFQNMANDTTSSDQTASKAISIDASSNTKHDISPSTDFIVVVAKKNNYNSDKLGFILPSKFYVTNGKSVTIHNKCPHVIKVFSADGFAGGSKSKMSYVNAKDASKYIFVNGSGWTKTIQ